MAYLEIIIQNGSSGPVAISANGVSLAKEKGCLAFFLPSGYPLAEDYVRGLEYEGWRHYNTATTSTMGMIDGFPFADNQTRLIFTGDGRYQVLWVGDRWEFKDHSGYALSINMEKAKNFIAAQEWYNKAVFSNNFDDKIRCYTEAIRLDPKDGYTYIARGNAHKDQGNLAAAIKDFTEAIRLDPKDIVAYSSRGRAHLEQGNPTAAFKDYNEGIRLDPKDGYTYITRGLAHREQGNLTAAIKDFTEAIRLDPKYTYTLTYKTRGNAHKEQGNLAEAVKDYETYLELGFGLEYGDQAKIEKIIRSLKKRIQQ